MKILVTGTAGFIGFHLATRLAREDNEVVGIDVINDYYDVRLKLGRVRESGIAVEALEYGASAASGTCPRYRFIKLDMVDRDSLRALFEAERFDAVCHLAAQAGVRYSLQNPFSYIDSNINGFMALLEACRHVPVKHLVYASSSSIYGLNEKTPFSVHDGADHPVSLYAATKKSNELMAHTYSHLFGVPTTGLRFFSVYGPWGRPDMAYFGFTRKILAGEPIDIFNNGDMKRDFTYIDDIVEGLVRIMSRPPAPDASWDGGRPDPAASSAPYRVYNIGRGEAVPLMDFLRHIEKNLGVKATINMMPFQQGDVLQTQADITDLERACGYRPRVDVGEGIARFVEWFKGYYGV